MLLQIYVCFKAASAGPVVLPIAVIVCDYRQGTFSINQTDFMYSLLFVTKHLLHDQNIYRIIKTLHMDCTDPVEFIGF